MRDREKWGGIKQDKARRVRCEIEREEEEEESCCGVSILGRTDEDSTAGTLSANVYKKQPTVAFIHSPLLDAGWLLWWWWRGLVGGGDAAGPHQVTHLTLSITTTTISTTTTITITHVMVAVTRGRHNVQAIVCTAHHVVTVTTVTTSPSPAKGVTTNSMALLLLLLLLFTVSFTTNFFFIATTYCAKRDFCSSYTVLFHHYTMMYLLHVVLIHHHKKNVWLYKLPSLLSLGGFTFVNVLYRPIIFYDYRSDVCVCVYKYFGLGYLTN